jgi:hypothetical protein
MYLRKVELDSFKSFLKENDAILFYTLWIEIEKLKTILDEKEKNKYIKCKNKIQFQQIKLK